MVIGQIGHFCIPRGIGVPIPRYECWICTCHFCGSDLGITENQDDTSTKNPKCPGCGKKQPVVV